jgi:Polyketide cyclase / dehydrase and lipid transport
MVRTDPGGDFDQSPTEVPLVSRMICSAQRTLTEDIPAPPDQVREFYVDLNNIRLVHPLVVSVRTIAQADTGEGYAQTYRVTDRIPLGRFTLRTRYTARLHVPLDGDVIAEARQFPLVRLHSVVTFDEIDNGTRIVEHMRIQAPRLLAAVTVRQAVQAHAKMWFNIREHFA